jgi:hypothetical protein
MDRNTARHDTAQALTGSAAVVLAIIGLLGLTPVLLASIGVIVTGADLLLAAGETSAREARFEDSGDHRGVIVAGWGGDSLLGGAAIALGVLALVGVAPRILLPIAALALGGGLVLGSMATARVEAHAHAWHATHRDQVVSVQETVPAGGGLEMLIGLGAIVLGILGLTGRAPVAVTLVAVLGTGGALLLAGSAIAARVMMRRRHVRPS